MAIVDPPYGLGKKLKPRGGMIGKSFNGMGEHSWDAVQPKNEYWKELFRVSKNQIVWGGNYFIDYLKPTQCFLVWDKQNGDNPMSDCEFAWISIKNKVARLYSGHIFKGIGNSKYKPIHPTQKPVRLYAFTFKHFATEGMKILDTHFGSGSIALAVDKANRLDKMNLHLTACEIDKEYIDKAIKRISESIKQGTLSF